MRGRLVLVPVLFCVLAGVFAGIGAGSTHVVPTTISFGITDDATKYSDDGGAAYFGDMHDLGMVENRVIVFWDENAPTTILEQGFLDRMMPVAAASGIRIVLAIQPIHAKAFATNTQARIAAFTAYVREVALRYPQVREFVIGNEPNVRRFFQPQHAAGGAIVSASVYEQILAASYDTLKSIDPTIKVDGLGLSPQGNDQPLGSGAESVSPVRFIAALGAAYRQSGRKAPIADVLDVHSYAALNTIPLTTPRKWPQAGPADLDRLKQAWWDAFHGTGQPVFQETGVKAKPATKFITFRIDELGTQVAIDPTKVNPALYQGKENVPTVSEATQATYYTDAINLLKCDPTVSTLDLFHLIDEPLLLGFQSGLLRVDGSRRPSYAAVKAVIATAKTCPALHAWRHTTSVVGASAYFSTTPKIAAQKVWFGTVRTGEEATVQLGIFPIATARTSLRSSLADGPSAALLQLGGFLKANSARGFKFHGSLSPGRYVYAALLKATMNPQRTSLIVSKPFVVR
ncbi:MAG TPA: hypothetical protein VLJ76_08010 [Gaiellaceae bacterium]|nr:hypothetical protein [Gaiellaceae bacterium]